MDTTQRGTTKDGTRTEETRSLSMKISDLLRKGRVPLLVVAGLLVAAVLVIAAVTWIGASSDKAASLRMNILSQNATKWSSEADSTKKADLEKQLIADLDGFIAAWPDKVYAQQAFGMKAAVAESRKDWAEAETDWLAAAKVKPANFMNPVALQNAAAAAEELGAFDRAKLHYTALVDGYATTSAGIAHAWFALGRIAEESKDYPAALTNYEKVSASWPSSDWTKLAKDRIISIKARGLVK